MSKHRRALDRGGDQSVERITIGVTFDVDGNLDTTEPVADVAIDAEHATHVDRAPGHRVDPAQGDTAVGGGSGHPGGDTGGQCMQHEFLWGRAVAVAQGRMVGGGADSATWT